MSLKDILDENPNLTIDGFKDFNLNMMIDLSLVILLDLTK